MARKLKADEDGEVTVTHNATEQKKIIADAVASIIQLKAERKSINEQITKARAGVKAIGVKMIDLNVAIRMHEFEAEDRNSSLSNLRLCFEALNIGEQGTLFPTKAAA